MWVGVWFVGLGVGGGQVAAGIAIVKHVCVCVCGCVNSLLAATDCEGQVAATGVRTGGSMWVQSVRV